MKYVFTFLFVIFSFTAFTQDPSIIEQYCSVVVTGAVLSKKVTIEVDYGEVKKSWKPNRVKDEEGKLVKFNSVIDALNYFGKNGWKLVNAFPLNNATGSPMYQYVFRKEFSRDEVELL